MNYWHPAHIISTFFWIGRLPGAPGTWGSLAALPLAYYLTLYGGLGAFMVAIFVVLVIGIWASSVTEAALDKDDPGEIVIDEVVGMWLTVLFLPPDWTLYFLGFVVFRVFDIFKPWPVDHFDEHGNGGLGIMQDDVAAGLYGMLVLYVFLATFTDIFGAVA